MTWRERAKQIGPSVIASDMGVKIPTVLKYTKETSTTIPRKMMKPFCEVMRKRLTGEEFEDFLQSLSDEIGLVAEK